LWICTTSAYARGLKAAIQLAKILFLNEVAFQGYTKKLQRYIKTKDCQRLQITAGREFHPALKTL